MGLRAGTGRGKPGASQIPGGGRRGSGPSSREVEAVTEGLGCRNRGGRRPRAQAKDWKGELPAGNGNRWMGRIVDAQLRLPPSLCQHPHPAFMAPQPQGPRGGGDSDHLPLPQWGAMYASRQVGRSRTPVCRYVQLPVAGGVCLEGCVCCGCVGGVYVCVCLLVPRLCLPMLISVSGPLFVDTGLWPGGLCV